jgi:hypothetical protein
MMNADCKSLLRGALLALACAALAGCTTSSSEERVGRLLKTPGGYELYDCAQLAVLVVGLVNRDKELIRLMTKAKEGPAGGLVSAMAYEPEYLSNRGALHEVRKAQVEKNCPATPAKPNEPVRKSDTIIR